MEAPREHDLPHRQRHDQGIQPQDPDEDAVREPHSGTEPDAGEEPEGELVVGADADADDEVAPERDHARCGQVDAGVHDHEHLPECRQGEGQHPHLKSSPHPASSLPPQTKLVTSGPNCARG